MYKFCALLLILPLLAACGNRLGNAEPLVSAADSADVTAELPLPVIPSALVTPESRAAYIALHFWDEMDFDDHTLSLDTAFMEQNFANYLSVFPVIASQTDRSDAVASLLRKASGNDEALSFLQAIVDKYLRDPGSPMRDEELLIAFYERLMQMPEVSESDRSRIAWRLGMARKNRPGSVAADFSYVSRAGVSATLHGRAGNGPVLLMFYDPDCGSCGVVIEALALMRLPCGWKVLAIDAESDRRRWDETKALLPEEWEVGFATTDIMEDESYDLDAMPVFYLLDERNVVLLKDPSLELLGAVMADAYGRERD